MPFSYNPHQHFKIWLSKDPNVFMNLENQMRMMAMRIKNPTDTIHFVYDASLLNDDAKKKLELFCDENQFTSFNVNGIDTSKLSKNEIALFDYYQDEIAHLKAGGNLGVASDILRWISPIFNLGTYTDFDVPVDTTNLPTSILVESPLLLNIGSLKLGLNELVISNNDYISVVNENGARESIERIQQGILNTLGEYSTDFIENATRKLGGNSFLNTRISSYMKNRAESEYIEKSQQINAKIKLSSRELRAFIQEVTHDEKQFLEFNRLKASETNDEVIKRLRKNLSSQLNFIKWFFFNKEYADIKSVLATNDDKFLNYLMKRERSLYIKSVVVCTTGPIQIAKSLFEGYVFNTSDFNAKATPVSFNHYGLKKAFQSQNSVPLHETVLGMLSFLGAADGELNDSSWLEEGVQLQEFRQTKLIERQKMLRENLPYTLNDIKIDIQAYATFLENRSKGPFARFSQNTRRVNIKALREILACFHDDTHTFHIDEFRRISATFSQDNLFTRVFFNKTQRMITALDGTCTDAQVLLKIKAKNPVSFKPAPQLSVKQNGNYFILNQPKQQFNSVLYLLKLPFLLIRWIVSFFLARFVATVVLAPNQVRKQRPIHHISMSNNKALTADDLVVVNLIPHESNKFVKDLMLKWIDFTGFASPKLMKRFKLHLAQAKDKQHIDKMLQEIDRLISGSSTAKRCEGKSFTWDKIHFKGIEQLNEPLRDYFFSALKEKHGLAAQNTPRTTPLDFFTLETKQGAILDSVAALTLGEENKPMSERKFVITCLPREQNYINWIKDSANSARKIGCTVIGFNYRGIDYSQGMVWTQDNMINDTIAQVERLLALGAQAKNIGLEGDCVGGAVATIAAAILHERQQPVKLYNLRSFRSTSRFLVGYFLPDTTSSWLNPMTYLKYIAAGLSFIFLTPVILLSGWRLNATAAWDKIPLADKDYAVIRGDKHDNHKAPIVDGCIHDSWASIASHIEEQRAAIQLKQKHGNILTREENALLKDTPVSHYFKPGLTVELNEEAQAKANVYGQHPHFLSRRSLFSVIKPLKNNHEHMIDSFQAKFQRT